MEGERRKRHDPMKNLGPIVVLMSYAHQITFERIERNNIVVSYPLR